MIKILSAKLTGNPDDSGWVQVHDFRPDEPEKLKSKGRLIALISTESSKDVGINAVFKGREVLTRIHEEYFGSDIENAHECLKKALDKVSGEFLEIGEKIQIGAMVNIENILYIATLGGAKAYLLRQGTLVKLADATDRPSYATGVIRDKDTLLIATQKFFDGFPIGVIRASLESGTPESTVSDLAPVLHSKEKTGNIGVFVVRFEDSSSFPINVSQPLNSQQPAQEIQQPVASFQSQQPLTQNSIKGKVVGILDKLISFIPERRLYIRSDVREFGEEKKKSVAVIAGILLLLILGVSVFFGLRQASVKEAKSKYIDRLTTAQHQVDEARSLSELDREKARQLLFEAKETVRQLNEEGIKDKDLDSLQAKIEESMGDIAGIYKANTELYLDLSLLTSGFSGDKISLSSNNMLVLDKSGQRAVSVTVGTKKTQIVAGPDALKNAQAVAAYTDRNFVVDDNGISEIEGDTPNNVVGKDWNGDVELAGYTGNLYLLEKGNSAVWRFQGSGGSFGEKQNWFGAGISPDLTDTKSLSIDGSLWILGSGGKILKFTLGSPDSFNVKGVDGSLDGLVALFTSDEAENLYLLDREGSRIIVLDKNGSYKSQYLGDEIKNATGLVVSEDEGKIIILAGPKLYSIELKV